MTDFHCVLQVAPRDLPDFQTSAIDGQPIQTITLPHLETSFARSFEEAAAEMENLPRFFFEPDGSFVWVQEQEQRYQLDGSLYDDGILLLNVELKGTCNARMLDLFLACLGWPKQSILFQLVQYGVYLVESDFRQHYLS